MERKKIVFISFDEEYISTIEYKFAHLVEGTAEVEFITDHALYKRLMTFPEKIDYLVLPEGTMITTPENYAKTKIFYISEEHKSGGDPGVIYKYDSVKAILERIDPKLINSDSEEKKGTEVVGVYSVSGGTGVTIAALTIAYKLKKRGKRVLYISTTSQQDFSYHMGGESELGMGFSRQCSINMKNALKVVEGEIRNEDFDFLPMFRNLPMSYQIDFSTYAQIIDYFKAKNSYDFIITELSPEISGEKMRFINNTDRLIFLTTQDEIAVRKLETFMESMPRDKGNILIICNKYNAARKDFLQKSFVTRNAELAETVDEYQEAITYANTRESVLFETTVAILD